MQPAFHQSQIREMVATIRDETTRRVDAWQPALAAGQPLDMVDETIRLNIRIVLKTLFGSGVDEDQATEMVKETGDVFAGMSKRLWTFFAPPWLPLPGQRAYRGAITALEKRIYALMEDRRRRTTKEHDLLGALLQARDEETGEAMPDQRIRDEIFTLFLAGYESTATGVSWAWYLLAQHPEVAQRLRAEADAQLGTRDPEMEDLAKLPYAKRVVDEVFRLYPVFPMFFRTSIEADRIGPYAVPADASIVISPYATHRDPRFWNEPTRFDPDRFLPDRFTPRHGDAYYPFGKGQRLCIGKAMALTTAQVVISMIVRRFDLALAPGRNVEEHFAMTLQPKGGLPMLLRPRAAGRSS